MYFRKFASHLLWEIREKRREWYQFDGIWDEEGWYIKKFVVIVYTMVIYSSNVWWSSKSLNECQREVIAKIFAVFPSFFSPPAKNCHHVAIVNYSVPPSYNSNFVRVSRLRRWYKVNFEFSSSFFDRKSIIFSGEYKYLEMFRINFRENFSKFVKFLHKFQF